MFIEFKMGDYSVTFNLVKNPGKITKLVFEKKDTFEDDMKQLLSMLFGIYDYIELIIDKRHTVKLNYTFINDIINETQMLAKLLGVEIIFVLERILDDLKLIVEDESDEIVEPTNDIGINYKPFFEDGSRKPLNRLFLINDDVHDYGVDIALDDHFGDDVIHIVESLLPKKMIGYIDGKMIICDTICGDDNNVAILNPNKLIHLTRENMHNIYIPYQNYNKDVVCISCHNVENNDTYINIITKENRDENQS